MKKLHTILVALLITATTFAQVPEKMSYQAVVRDASGALVSEQLVGIEIEILYSQYGGTAYIETHFVNTNANGLVTLEIGTGSTGNVFNDFSAIQWDTIDGNWIYTKIDPLGGVNYTITNISQLLSVPYALYAKNSATTPNLEAVLAENNSANNQQIKDLQDPTDAQDAVTKNYTYSKAEVDALLANLQSQIVDLESDNSSGSITDQDGNTYNYLTYGDQVWTVDNAEMVTYRDGTAIPEVTDDTEWESLTTGAWCYYDNDPTKPRLYNWYAVAGIHDNDPNTPDKEFAPEGWHVPTDVEWTTLENYLIASGYNYDQTTTGNKIAKAMASTTGWNSSTSAGAPGNDQSLNNDSGFNAFPEGLRSFSGQFGTEGLDAFFWSSTVLDPNYVWTRFLNFNGSILFRSSYGSIYHSGKLYGFSVRFVRD